MSDSMAEKMKRKLSAKSVTAIILFGAIVMVFVFFGLPGPMGAGVGYVARVNNSLVSLADFQQEENRIQQYYQNLFGGTMDLSSQRQLLRQQALETLIRGELVAQAAQQNDILATDAEVRDYIINMFQQNGQFDREFYLGALQQNRMKPSDFEDKVRKDIASIRTRHLFEIANRPMKIEQAKLQELKANKINVAFVKLDQEKLNKDMTQEKADAAIKALDEALAAGDEAAANAQLKILKGQWEETGFVELGADSFPKINSQVANEAVFELSKGQPLLKRIVRDGPSKYVLKLKESKVDAVQPLDAMTAEMSQKRRADGMFEAWINYFREKSYVTMNTQALQLN